MSIEQEAMRLKDRVERLYAVYKSGAPHAVVREIGRLEITVEVEGGRGPVDYDAAMMSAIARKVIPEGWEWEVVRPIGPAAPHLVMKQYREPRLEYGSSWSPGHQPY